MAIQKRTAIVSIAALVMIVAMATSEVEARLSVGRNLLERTSERRYLTGFVDTVVGKHCCNKVINRCCAPAPAPTPTRKLAASITKSASAPKASKASSKSKSPKYKDGKSSPKSKSDDNKSSNRAKPPKAAPSQTKAAQDPKAMRNKNTSVMKN